MKPINSKQVDPQDRGDEYDPKVKKLESEKFPVSFRGEMVKGMAFMQMLSSIMLVCSGFHVYWNYNSFHF